MLPRDIFGYFFVDGMLLNRTLDDYEIELFLEHEERVPWRYENVFHPDFSSIDNEIFEFQRKCFNDGKLLEYKPEGGWGIHEWYKWLSD